MVVNVPYGGTIRNTVAWNAIVSGAGTKNFALVTFYFDKAGNPAFFTDKITINTGSATIETPLDLNTLDLLDDPSIYQTYDARTYVGDGDNPNFPYGGEGVYDEHFDTDVLTIVPAYGAIIISTLFTQL